MDHRHQTGRTCQLPGCGTPAPRIAAAVDDFLREITPGRTIPRVYVRDAVTPDLYKGSRPRGSLSRRNRSLRGETGSSWGSRLTPRITHRLKVLARVDAIQLIGTTHILVLDMNRAPDLPGPATP